jgi:hypothetical protein
VFEIKCVLHFEEKKMLARDLHDFQLARGASPGAFEESSPAEA